MRRIQNPTTYRTQLIIAAMVAVLAFAAPLISRYISPSASSTLSLIRALVPFSNGTISAAEQQFACRPHAYTTEIVSLDPLLIYIHEFLAPAEIAALLAAGEPEFAPSEVTKRNRKQHTADRTSQSAGLPPGDPAVRCVLSRAQQFMGALLDPARGEIGPPQLVRYTAGQRFNVHHDWYERPQPAKREKMGLGRSWNRVASFFAVLQDDCTGGETHFPYVEPVRRDSRTGIGEGGVWFERDAESGGGVAFKPVKGNALFWVNLHANGTGDERVMHAGLPLGDGLKTAMNIWPRQYYP
ncbi:hypothetical protein BKA67DRAFT_552138 [Truncatella angustata]|uniref:Prolyl 4-hydroxylase alpha subunit domain-containing protein n=1 Tax=Truncatella angustata TaxID=152316 RepID=A0A9P8UQS9_9PEZI|nr:uncharacterized protein BKA67DRAFT_552138 [Truncatella angustata]KAH6656491.1 hypothetical protein BKA67DRAFT_552138 [Truncatella angustata]KAH8200002.1 hypothetical protein TruAng_005829 [Truncatella angustata]